MYFAAALKSSCSITSKQHNGSESSPMGLWALQGKVESVGVGGGGGANPSVPLVPLAPTVPLVPLAPLAPLALYDTCSTHSKRV